MSVIACKIYDDRIELASDSITVRGCSKRTDAKLAKLARVNDVVVGGVGLSSENGLMQIFLRTHTPDAPTEQSLLGLLGEFSEWKHKRTGNAALENEYIFGVGGKAFRAFGYYVDEVVEHCAIGAGEDHAVTALFLGRDPVAAVEIAIKLSVYCEGPVVTQTIPRNPAAGATDGQR